MIGGGTYVLTSSPVHHDHHPHNFRQHSEHDRECSIRVEQLEIVIEHHPKPLFSCTLFSLLLIFSTILTLLLFPSHYHNRPDMDDNNTIINMNNTTSLMNYYHDTSVNGTMDNYLQHRRNVNITNINYYITPLEQMALLHNSLSGGPAPVSDVNEVSSSEEERGIHRYGPDDLILYALSGE